VDQAAEAIAADDLAGWLDGLAPRQRRDQPERLVRPRRVVVGDVRAEHLLEVPLAGVDHLIDCVRQDRVPMVDVEDAVKTQEIVFAAELTARKGRPIKPPLPC